MKALKTFFEFTLVVMCMLCMAGCQNDEYAEPETEEVNEPGLYLSLNTLGDGSGSGTRVMNNNDAYVNSLYALYFEGTGTDDTNFTFVEIETVNLGSTPLDLTSAKVLKLKPTTASTSALASGKTTWKIVFIANMTPTTPTTGTTLAAFKATPQVTNSSVLWQGKNNLSTGIEYIPMYYCTGGVTLPNTPYDDIYYINDTGSNTAQTHELVRMMAKFTILNTKVTATSELNNFLITEISVINGYEKGWVYYDNWSSSRVTTPTLPTTQTAIANSSVISGIEGWSSDKQTIVFYTFERNVTTGSSVNNITDNCYIKLKGDRFDSSDNPVTGVYYMLPIYAINSGDLSINYNSPGPILRNHNYQYTIAGVNLYSLRVSLKVAGWTDVPINAKPLPLD